MEEVSLNHRISVRLTFFVIATLSGTHGRGGVHSKNYMQPCEGGLGVCTTAAQCRHYAGFPVGSCALSTCCRVVRSCDEIITQNNSFFVEHALAVGRPCNVDVQKIRTVDDVCQMRLDMEEFMTVGPDPFGACSVDKFEVRGQRNRVPAICGWNSGQHFYLDVRGVPTVQLTMMIGMSDMQRVWKIRVTQIPCHSERLAPRGCLQYLEEPSGSISSFNYGNPDNTSYPVIHPTSYAICFPGECHLALAKAGPFGMTSGPQMSSVMMENLSRSNIDTNCQDPKDLAWPMQKSFLSIDHTKFCGDNFPDHFRSAHLINQMSVVIYPKEYNRSVEFYPGFRMRYRLNCAQVSGHHQRNRKGRLKGMRPRNLELGDIESTETEETSSIELW